MKNRKREKKERTKKIREDCILTNYTPIASANKTCPYKWYF